MPILIGGLCVHLKVPTVSWGFMLRCGKINLRIFQKWSLKAGTYEFGNTNLNPAFFWNGSLNAEVKWWKPMNTSAASSVDPNDPLLFLLQRSHQIHLQHLSYLKGTRFLAPVSGVLDSHPPSTIYHIRIIVWNLNRQYVPHVFMILTFKIQFSINGSVVVHLSLYKLYKYAVSKGWSTPTFPVLENSRHGIPKKK